MLEDEREMCFVQRRGEVALCVQVKSEAARASLEACRFFLKPADGIEI